MKNKELKHLSISLERIVKSYKDSGMKRIIPEDIFGFFPYGNGLDVGVQKFPSGKIMVLGQDFGNQEYVSKLYLKPDNGERKKENPTWRNLITILDKSEIELSDCFFTNSIMGVRKKGENIMGKSPPFKSKNKNGKEFIDYCYDFFVEQVNIQRPKLIICLGKYVYHFLKQKNDGLFRKFTATKNYKDLPMDSYLIKDVKFYKLDHFKTNIVLIVHPSTPFRKYRSVQEEIDFLIKNVKPLL